jgi:hypothetical protein
MMGLLDKKEEVEVKDAVSPIIVEEAAPEKVEKVVEVKDKPKTNPARIVDTEEIEFTESVNFEWLKTIYNKKVGEVMTVSKELRDILLKRGCVRIKPN